MIVVVDASVALKWFFQGRSDEEYVERALVILEGVSSNRLTMIQPAHFAAEVASVLAREKPAAAQRDLADLQQVDWAVDHQEHHYDRAVEIAVGVKSHLFDTLYHAVALSKSDALLVTADQSYYARAKQFGQIALLRDFEHP